MNPVIDPADALINATESANEWRKRYFALEDAADALATAAEIFAGSDPLMPSHGAVSDAFDAALDNYHEVRTLMEPDE